MGFRQHAGIFVRGVAMGAADVVPGVSGGTVAFITGIYFRLLGAIGAVPSAFYLSLAKGHWRRFWHEIDGTFLVTLLAGILLSIATLANLITRALDTYPVALWSFFFGLILASVWHVLGQMNERRWWLFIPVVLGAAFAWWVTTLSATQIDPGALVFFFSGALAICAMILPGLSGSFVLLMLGMYGPVLAAVREMDLVLIGLFLGGCLVGLLSFARLLGMALRKAHDLVLAVLTGLMVGALNRVWPWQEVIHWRTSSGGDQVPLEQVSVLPMRYAEVTGEPAHITVAIAAVLAGLAIVLLGEWLAGRIARVSPATQGM
jgi:putative membrane protein